MGHKGPGSLFVALSHLGLISNTYVNSVVHARGFGQINVGLQLTSEGLKNPKNVVECVFQVCHKDFTLETFFMQLFVVKFIGMLRREGPQKYFWKELRDTRKLQFIYPEIDTPLEFVRRHAYMLQVSAYAMKI